jgi:uncharacterized protein (UPF0261 family)
MEKTIVLLGTLNTKGIELGYIKEKIAAQGYSVIVVDVSFQGSPPIEPDITRDQVAEAGGAKFEQITSLKQEEVCEPMTAGAVNVIQELYRSGKLDGILSLGGSVATSLATAAMRALPIGVPKVMVSTVASGDTRPYVGTKDITMISSVTDVEGLNRVTKRFLATAAGAIMGMVAADPGPLPSEKPLIAVSIRGDKVPCLRAVRALLEERGYEVVPFHAVGTGGRALEEWVEQGLIDAVLDLTTVELTEHLFGGRFDAGPDRLEAAGRKGIPQVVAPGSIGFASFYGEEGIPQRLRGRKVRMHNPSVAVVWLNNDEMAFVGRVMAEKLNKALGPTAVIIPKRGVGGGGWQDEPEADLAFVNSLKKHLKPGIEVLEVDAHINDMLFAEKAVALLLELLHKAHTSNL